jgi:hypothetical protein
VTLLGIDPGYDRLGWAVGTLTGAKLGQIQFGTIQTNPKATLFERYGVIDQELTKILKEFQPCEAALESLFFNKNVTTAIHVLEIDTDHRESLFVAHQPEIADETFILQHPDDVRLNPRRRHFHFFVAFGNPVTDSGQQI